jgi:hypothetical protein
VYDRFAGMRAALPAPVEQHFEDAIRNVKQLEKARGTSKSKRPPRTKKP